MRTVLKNIKKTKQQQKRNENKIKKSIKHEQRELAGVAISRIELANIKGK